MGACPVESYFLEAPKFVLFLLTAESFSLSSRSFSFLFSLLVPLVPAADDGVGTLDAFSLKDVDIGVGACEAGVDPGVPDSY